MRFLYTFAALSLSSLSLASGQTLFPSQNQNCVVKTTSSSLGSTACQIQQSAWVNILDTTPISVPIPTFDENAVPAGAILDAVHINWIDLGYQASGTYNVTSTGGSASSFSVITSVANNNVWLLYSDVDGSTIDALSGGFSVNPGTGGATGNPCRTETDTQATPHTTICRNGDIYSKPFQLTDDRYASSTLNSGTVVTFSADFGVTGTVTSFEGLPVNSATSGYALVGNSISFNLNAVPSNSYKSSTSPTWNLITGTASNTPAHISGTLSVTTGATGVGLYLSHTLTALVQVQYDYHLPAVGGDPQFSGFQGQNFQVHGAPESYFALISAPNYYVNARFDYLSTGRCDYNETQCFTHPGTYMGLIYVGMKDANILIQAGPHTTGFAGILVNDKPITVGDRFTLSSISSNSYIQVLSKSKLVLSLDNIIINVINSDLFVNFDLALTDKQLLTTGAAYHVMPNGATSSQIAHKLSKWYGAYNPLHGLIGQTWRNVKYADNKLYQGDITEYQLDKIIDHTFLYCVYEP